MNNYLMEIGVEELPSRFIESALSQLREKAEKLLIENKIKHGDIQVFATPRRLTLFINDVDITQTEIDIEIKGPNKKIAFDEEGNPTKPLEGFMRSQNISLDQIFFKELKGVEYVFASVHKKSDSFEEIIEKNMPELIKSINFPKNMKWGGKNIKFARPIRWLVSLLNDKILYFDLEGIKASNITRGHRFLGSNNIVIDDATNYEKLLDDNFVILDQVKRKEMIKYGSKKLAKSFGGELKDDPELLEELTYIVEYPTPILGRIKEEYLELPQDVITTPMKEHLRYTPVYDSKGDLMPYFITIRNGNEEYSDIVVAGNEKVLDARLHDAKFFYNEDLKIKLEDNVDKLSGIVFQENLGTMHDKTKRVQELSKKIGEYLEVADETLNSLDRAAYLSKTDLLTNMVQEFTELQGNMGSVYANCFGESEIVCRAIKEQYLPRYAGDKLPESTIGSILAIADKMDTIVGLFAIGLVPTGSQDPFGLRRSAIGIINILNNNRWDISLSELIDYSLYIYVEDKGLAFNYNKVKSNIIEFFYGRIKNMLLQQDIRYDIVDAILDSEDDNILNIFIKAKDIDQWFKEESREKFVDAFTRLENIVINKEINTKFNIELLESKEEELLYESFSSIKEEVDNLICDKKYTESLNLLSSLENSIENYFDNVMVLVEDEKIKNNRLSMLKEISQEIKKLFNIKTIVQ